MKVLKKQQKSESLLQKRPKIDSGILEDVEKLEESLKSQKVEEKSQTKSDTPSAKTEQNVAKSAPVNLSSFFKKVSPAKVGICNKLNLASSTHQKENTNSHSNI